MYKSLIIGGMYMSGIAGIFSKNGIDNIEIRIKKMGDTLSHRGPDSTNIKIFNSNIALAHRRLKVIDLCDKSNQPMISRTKRYTIVYDGQIYNFKEIKNELNQYKFITQSDTEVLLAAMELKGIDWLVNRLNGMFAIVIFDSKDNKIYMLRDRFGEKPLYYSIVNNTLLFASEIKSILSSGLVEAKFNEEAIDNYLANRYVREPYTFFKNIYQVKAGTLIIIDSEINLKEKEYWTLPRLNRETSWDEKHILENLNEILTNAIRIRLASEVELGTYLSGGVDSSLITAIVSKIKKNSIHTYTIGFEEEKYNEFYYSNLVAKYYNTNHHIINMKNEDYFNKWDELIWYNDAPLGVPNEIPLAKMTEVLKNDITVVLSGEGADELFGGYGRIYRSFFEYSKASQPISFYEYFINKYEYVPREIRNKYLNTSLNYREEFDQLNVNNIFNNYYSEETIFRFFYSTHIKGLLQRLDTTTARAGVEGRAPFLDYKLVEYTFTEIPYNLKLKWKNDKSEYEAKHIDVSNYSEKLDIPKYILKKLSYKYLPKEVIERKKWGSLYL